MPADEKLVARIRRHYAGEAGVIEKKMFGGVTFLVNGNMACGVTGDVLVVRVGADAYEAALGEPHARPCDFTGRPLKGMLMVDAPGWSNARRLAEWVERGVAFARSLPAK